VIVETWWATIFLRRRGKNCVGRQGGAGNPEVKETWQGSLCVKNRGLELVCLDEQCLWIVNHLVVFFFSSCCRFLVGGARFALTSIIGRDCRARWIRSSVSVRGPNQYSRAVMLMDDRTSLTAKSAGCGGVQLTFCVVSALE